MKKLEVVSVLVCLFLITDSSFAYLNGTTYNWDSSVPNYNPSATIHTGTIDTSAISGYADFVGGTIGTTATHYGSHVNWDDGSYVTGVGDINTNGDTLDGYWVGFVSFGGWWDLGTPSSSVTIFGSQTGVGTSFNRFDYLEEGLDYIVFGSNALKDDSSLGPQATVTEIYLDGWRTHNPSEDTWDGGNGWCHDDITTVFDLHGSYRYINPSPTT